MNRIQDLDHKILRLKAQKEQAETRMAKILLKKIQTILGQDCDMNLVTLLLEEIWTKADTSDKERWRQQAQTFHSVTRTKTVPEDQQKIEATHDTKTNP